VSAKLKDGILVTVRTKYHRFSPIESCGDGQELV